ncbi:MAG: hypothetical protein H6791_02975 [Candidatus Nomurabacteria bacterium]|nr:MAG: hypothetical protein H6791_02975 [Candidatus Nomurabacteria bacterium]
MDRNIIMRTFCPLTRELAIGSIFMFVIALISPVVSNTFYNNTWEYGKEVALVGVIISFLIIFITSETNKTSFGKEKFVFYTGRLVFLIIFGLMLVATPMKTGVVILTTFVSLFLGVAFSELKYENSPRYH